MKGFLRFILVSFFLGLSCSLTLTGCSHINGMFTPEEEGMYPPPPPPPPPGMYPSSPYYQGDQRQTVPRGVEPLPPPKAHPRNQKYNNIGRLQTNPRGNNNGQNNGSNNSQSSANTKTVKPKQETAPAALPHPLSSKNRKTVTNNFICYAKNNQAGGGVYRGKGSSRQSAIDSAMGQCKSRSSDPSACFLRQCRSE